MKTYRVTITERHDRVFYLGAVDRREAEDLAWDLVGDEDEASDLVEEIPVRHVEIETISLSETAHEPRAGDVIWTGESLVDVRETDGPTA